MRWMQAKNGVTRAVATTFYRLLAVKDEQKSRACTLTRRVPRSTRSAFEGVAGKDFGIKFNLAPPTLTRPHSGGNPTKKNLRSMDVAGSRRAGKSAWTARHDARSVWPHARAQDGARTADDYETTLQRALAKLDAAISKTPRSSPIRMLACAVMVMWGEGREFAGVKRGERVLAARLQIEAAATGASVKKSLEDVKGAGQLCAAFRSWSRSSTRCRNRRNACCCAMTLKPLHVST